MSDADTFERASLERLRERVDELEEQQDRIEEMLQIANSRISRRNDLLEQILEQSDDHDLSELDQ